MLSEVPRASDFMSKKLITSFSQSNVSRAVKLMVDYNIGSVIIKDNEGPLGIFTERDLLKVLARNRRLEEPILLEVMTPSFNELSRSATLIDAAKIMTEKKGRLMVFDDGNPIGIVTATDIVREIHRAGKPFDFTTAYSRQVSVAPPRATVESVIQLMDLKRIGSVIVSEGRFSRGIFTERDLLRSVLTPDFRMDEQIENLATHHLVTAEEGINGLEAAEIMTSQRIKRLPLKKDGEICGIVTARDLVEGLANSSW
jgi:CBS domain-containing protein